MHMHVIWNGAAVLGQDDENTISSEKRSHSYDILPPSPCIAFPLHNFELPAMGTTRDSVEVARALAEHGYHPETQI